MPHSPWDLRAQAQGAPTRALTTGSCVTLPSLHNTFTQQDKGRVIKLINGCPCF